MWNYIHSDELYHHGIKGQKWGVRRSEAQLRRARGWTKTDAQKDSEADKKYDRNNRGTLSNSQLREKIERLKLEKELRELTAGEVNRGRSAVMGVIRDIGKSTVTKVTSTALAGAALYGLKAAVTKQFDPNDFGNAIFNGGGKKK